ncbi:hypothetical protein LINPERHAP2_LOCUS4535 [Linum perenne]
MGSPEVGENKRKSKRHRSAKKLTISSPARVSMGGNLKTTKNKKSSSSANQGDESPSAVDQPFISKHSRRPALGNREPNQRSNEINQLYPTGFMMHPSSLRHDRRIHGHEARTRAS